MWARSNLADKGRGTAEQAIDEDLDGGAGAKLDSAGAS